jgi:methionyl-tRNA formyltransferase
LEERRSVASQLPRCLPPPDGTVEARIDFSQDFSTLELLNCLYYLQTEGELMSPSFQFALDKLVQRFEVTKRLHRSYNSRFRAVDKDSYQNLELYIRFSEVLAVSYEKTQDLPYLNALLKCLDTVCSYKDSLNQALKARLSGLIRMELEFCQRMQTQLGIDLSL